ncbi:hypothetical protein AX16_009500 [Volvariella volvacea WC 439]|nr:hypothetical protein AX16_009500 [Volvariella volvacea WC 439]
MKLEFDTTIIMLVHVDNLTKIGYENKHIFNALEILLKASLETAGEAEGFGRAICLLEELDKWSEVVNASLRSTLGSEAIARGIRVFSDRAFAVIEQALPKVKSLQEKIDAIEEVMQSCSWAGDVPRWYHEQRLQAAALIDMSSLDDVPALRGGIKSEGLMAVVGRLIPRMHTPTGCHEVWLALVGIISSYGIRDLDEHQVRHRKVVEYCLVVQIFPKWNDNPRQTASSATQRILDTVKFCIKNAHQDLVKQLLDRVLSPPEAIPGRLGSVYVPLAPSLVQLLEHNRFNLDWVGPMGMKRE